MLLNTTICECKAFDEGRDKVVAVPDNEEGRHLWSWATPWSQEEWQDDSTGVAWIAFDGSDSGWLRNPISQRCLILGGHLYIGELDNDYTKKLLATIGLLCALEIEKRWQNKEVDLLTLKNVDMALFLC